VNHHADRAPTNPQAKSAPETRYARSADGVHIAYQAVGDGHIDLILCQEWMTHLEVSWETRPLLPGSETWQLFAVQS
jgi:hypothetical protein